MEIIHLLALLLTCACAMAQLWDNTDWINPSGDEWSQPVWTLQSKQTLEWNTKQKSYSIYLSPVGIPSDVRDALELKSVAIYHSSNSTGHNTYEWTVDIASELVALTSTFRFSLVEYDTSAQMGGVPSGNFTVSDPSEDEIVPIASTSTTTSSESSTTSLADATSTTLSSSASEETTPLTAVGASGTSTLTLKTSPTSIASTASSSTASHRTVKAIAETSVTTSHTSTEEPDLATMTAATDGSLRPLSENDRGIWIGISLGLGLPVAAMTIAGLVWGMRRQRTGAVALNY